MITADQRYRLARTLSAVQDGATNGSAAAQFYRMSESPSPVVAVTGPPGAGKSTLMDRLALHWAEAGKPVAVLAIDPSSPFSGGAMLGDRIRANAATSHPEVFFRSLSPRGSQDLQALTIVDSCTVLSTFGFHRILLETVGAGQMDLEALHLADCVIALSAPGMGDEVQLSKAGLLEIADIHVVNKADLDGAKRLAMGLEGMVDLAYPKPGGNVSPQRPSQPGYRALLERHGNPENEARLWKPPVISVSAVQQADVSPIVAATDNFLEWAAQSGRARKRYLARLRMLVGIRLKLAFLEGVAAGDAADLDETVANIAAGRSDPAAAAHDLMTAVRRGSTLARKAAR